MKFERPRTGEGIMVVKKSVFFASKWIAFYHASMDPDQPVVKLAEGDYRPIARLEKKDWQAAREIVKREILRQMGECSPGISYGPLIYSFGLEEFGMSKEEMLALIGGIG